MPIELEKKFSVNNLGRNNKGYMNEHLPDAFSF